MTVTSQGNVCSGQWPLPSVRRFRRRRRPSTLVVAVCLTSVAVCGVVGGGPRTVAAAAVDSTTWQAPPCDGGGRTVVRPPVSAQPVGSQWEAHSPPDDVTYDLSGLTSTAYPATTSPIAVGSASPGLRTCVVGGTVLGQADDARNWEYYHDRFNAACLRVAAREWMQVHGLRCDNVEDGIKAQEARRNANNAQVLVSGTYLSRIRDDCMENDQIVGGVLHDNLWEQCNTGISERPTVDSWNTPTSETLVLDHMLIGLYPTPHHEGGRDVMGENVLFKWSSSANRVVIRCSIFKVDSVSLNGPNGMAIPPGTVIDDSACPGNPSTIVWLGGGDYPASTAGMRVVADPAVWTTAVTAWKTAHGLS